MSTLTTPLLTAEHYAELPRRDDGWQDELVRGEIVLTPLDGWLHGSVQANVSAIVLAAVDAGKLGSVTIGSGVIVERNPDTVRGPDVAFWSYERLPEQVRPRIWPDVVPDLIVEVLSPSDQSDAMREMVDQYLRAGVRLVWIVDLEMETVTIHSAAAGTSIRAIDERMTAEDVLPNFNVAVRDFFGVKRNPRESLPLIPGLLGS